MKAIDAPDSFPSHDMVNLIQFLSEKGASKGNIKEKVLVP